MGKWSFFLSSFLSFFLSVQIISTIRAHTLPTRPEMRSPARTHNENTHLAYKTWNQVTSKNAQQEHTHLAYNTWNQVASKDTQWEHTPCLQDPKSGRQQGHTVRIQTLPTRSGHQQDARTHKKNTHTLPTRPGIRLPARMHNWEQHTLPKRPEIRSPARTHNKNTHLAYKTQNQVTSKDAQLRAHILPTRPATRSPAKTHENTHLAYKTAGHQ